MANGDPVMNKNCYIYKTQKSGDVKKLVLFQKIKRHETLVGKKQIGTKVFP